MNYRLLGETGLNVSELGFGCGELGGLLIRGDTSSMYRVVARAIEMGINFFDTAPAYGNGESEINLGRILRKISAEVYVCTKVRIPRNHRVNIMRYITESVEHSLKRLQREHIDILHLHNPIGLNIHPKDEFVYEGDPIGEIAATFESLKNQGKIRFHGITALGDTQALHRTIQDRPFNTVQVWYNLLNPSAGNPLPSNSNVPDFGGLIEHATARKMGVIAISILASGSLSGTYSRTPIAASPVNPNPSGLDYSTNVGKSKKFSPFVLKGYVQNLAEAAIRFVLTNHQLSTALIGYSDLAQLEESLRYASRGPLPSEMYIQLPEVWEQLTNA